ncbi:MAG: tRNA (cytosine(32)/uridine(32)-2'-O)-methyltransferase TrmJ [Pseudomonadales bacterium]|nr:tRNA (cytosine(32)/uridine(32)-2'-O)-methyltransferase TrmJ [Pseudomonadales bacterium]
MSTLLGNIRIVLVETTHPGNIGGTARAMKNMGLSSLYLVNPLEYPSDKAQWRASNARDTLAAAKVVASLDDAIADCGLVIGTSARDRRIPWPLFNPKECAARSVDEAAQHPVAIVFGREDRGLTNEELHKCHYHVHIPTNPDYSSLNLAAAVQVICYELRMSWLERENHDQESARQWDIEPATAEAVEHYFRHLEQTMIDIGFHDPSNPRQTMTRLRRLYNRIRLDEMELSILRGILTGTQRLVNSRTVNDKESL